MPILYVAVFKGSVTAAEFATIDGNFNAVAKEYLAKAGRNAGKYTYETEGTTFNFLAQNGMSELCMVCQGAQCHLRRGSALQAIWQSMKSSDVP